MEMEGKGVAMGDKDFYELRDLLARIKGEFFMTINDTPKTRELFKRFNIEEVPPKYSTSRSLKSRSKKRTELLVSNFI